MDVLSHGLWGGIAFGRKSRSVFLVAFLFGMAPDAAVFGLEFIRTAGTFFHAPDSLSAMPFPDYVLMLYRVTHSIIISLALCLVVLRIWRMRAIGVLAWPVHVVFDIVSHNGDFFPTPFLWPFATPFVDGIPWVMPWVFFGNWSLLVLLYISWFILKDKKVAYASKKKNAP